MGEGQLEKGIWKNWVQVIVLPDQVIIGRDIRKPFGGASFSLPPKNLFFITRFNFSEISVPVTFPENNHVHIMILAVPPVFAHHETDVSKLSCTNEVVPKGIYYPKIIFIA